MDRISGFLLILFTRTFWVAHSLDLNIPFEIDVSKFKLPEAFYPENDREAISVFHAIRKNQFPSVDVKNYKLPEEFYPENDRDAISILPIMHNVIPKSDSKLKKLPEGGVGKMLLSGDSNPSEERKSTIFLRRFLQPSTSFEPYIEDRSDKSVYTQPSNTLDDDVYLSKKEKQVMALKRRILEDLMLLRILEGEDEESKLQRYLYV